MGSHLTQRFPEVGAGWVLDLDGVIWLGDDPIPGSAAACNRLRDAGTSLVFVTNMSALTVEQQEAKLGRHGIDAEGHVVTSAMAVATLTRPGERAAVIGGPGVHEALAAADVDVVADGPVDIVVVGMDQSFDYAALKRATLAIRSGARLLATNDDPSYPTTEGLLPGAGSILAAVERATGATAVVAGKPHEAAASLIRSQLGTTGVVVGDRPETDGAFAVTIGYDFALVLSGAVSREDLPVTPAPTVVTDDLATLVEQAFHAHATRD